MAPNESMGPNETIRSESITLRPSDPNALRYWLQVKEPGFEGLLVDEYGKWCIVCTCDAVDAGWSAVKELVVRGDIPAAKVSTAFSLKFSGFRTHVICAYTRSWIDVTDVARARHALRESGFTESLRYKRNIETVRPNRHFEFYYEDGPDGSLIRSTT